MIETENMVFLNTSKAQSAIEYLMTYGWMLLVVAITGGTIFSVVQGSGIQSVSGFSGSDVVIDDFGMSSDEELVLAVSNSAADRINVKAVELEDPDTGATTRVLLESEIEVGGSGTVSIDGFETTGSVSEQTIRVIYDTEGLEDLSVEGTITGNLKAMNHVYLQNAEFNRSTDILTITAINTGISEADNIDYSVNSDSDSFTGSLGSLSSGETKSFMVNTDETFSLQNVSLEVEGPQFTNSSKDLRCTPTKGLVGYWPFNQEQTKNGWALDLSGYENNGTIDESISTGEPGEIGESYKFKGRGSVKIDDRGSLNPENICLSVRFKPGNWPNESWKGWLVRHSEKTYGIFGTRPNTGVTFERRNSNFDFNGVGTSFTQWDQNEFYQLTGVWNSEKRVIYKGSSVQNEISSDFNYRENNNELHIGYSDFNGTIDEVRIYNRTLGQSEIRRLNSLDNEEWAVKTCKLAG